jgi:hypothetical protein
MPRHAKEREAQVHPRGCTTTATRSMPAFRVMVRVDEKPGETEAVEGGFWASGIDYKSVKVPSSTSSEPIKDRLDVLELLD